MSVDKLGSIIALDAVLPTSEPIAQPTTTPLIITGVVAIVVIAAVILLIRLVRKGHERK